MTIKFELLRPDDLLNLQIEADNLKPDITEPEDPVLVPDDPEKPSYLIVTFPPQTIVEEAFYESSDKNPPSEEINRPDSPYNDTERILRGDDSISPVNPQLPVESRIGGSSRLVFRIPSGSDVRIPFTLEGLLKWDTFELSVSPLADIPPEPTDTQRNSAPPITEPDRLETAIELPYRLIISPNHAVTWQYFPAPKQDQGISELWHTRMALKSARKGITPLSKSDPAPLRAVWSPDFNPDKFNTDDPPEFGVNDEDMEVRTAMTPSDRHEIVVLTSAFHGYTVGKNYTTYIPAPVYAEQLMLSPLGGWLKSHGAWDPPMSFRPNVIILELDEQVKQDQYVKNITKILSKVDIKPDLLSMMPLSHDFISRSTETLEEHEMDEFTTEEFTTGDSPNAAIFEALNIEDSSKKLKLGEWGDLLNMSAWTHIATQGRDHYVRIVYEGHLYPFGHRASLIKVTERKIRDWTNNHDGKSTPLAYLVQRMFLVVRQPLKDYEESGIINLLDHAGRELPFKNIRLTTLVTPDIADPKGDSKIVDPEHLNDNTPYSFWVRLGNGKDFKFHAIGEDKAGNQVNFTCSLIFIPFGENFDNREVVASQYQKSGEARACVVPGQKITYYVPLQPGAGNENTSLTTTKLYFSTKTVPDDLGDPDDDLKKIGGFLPRLHMANVSLPAVEAILGKSAETTIAFADQYLNNDANNSTGLFAKVVKEVNNAGNIQLNEDKLHAEFTADKAGGFATPDLSISGLTSMYGPLAGTLDNIAQDSFDPINFFNGVSAKLFGDLRLEMLLKKPTPANPLTMNTGAPKIQFQKEEIIQDQNQKWKMIATLDWTPAVEELDTGIVKFKPDEDLTKLEIHGRSEKIIDLTSTASSPGFAKMDGSLTNFTIELLHIVEILFDHFKFHSETGKKLDVNVKLNSDTPVRFIEDLQFVDTLREMIPPGLFGDGPSLDINLTRVKAGFSIALPPLSVGVFSLQDVVLAAFLELPFLDGKPIFDFGFSSRERPFNLTVSFLGGGGFFHLQLDTAGIKMLEAALEFGASTSIDLGVASGGVHIMAGIYFSVQKKMIAGSEVDAATLGGYLRMGGELSVLGLISVSLEFYLMFAYEAAKNEAYGRATLTVKVEVLFFSTSVEITVEKRFGGSSGDPTFLETFNAPAIWNEYAGAFA